MFERFTQDARDAVVAAQNHCRAACEDRITARHLVLAVADTPVPLASTLAAFGLTPARLQRPTAPEPDRPAGLSASDIEALRGLGIDMEAIQKAAEDTFGPGALHQPRSRRRGLLGRLRGESAPELTGPARKGDASPSHLPFSAGGKHSLEGALREALRLNSRQIRAAHIVLGALLADDADLPLNDIDVAGLRAAIEDELRAAA